MEASDQLQAHSHQAEPANSQQQDDFLNLERERNRAEYREGSVRTTHTSKSHSMGEVIYPKGGSIIKSCNRKLMI